MNEKKRIVLVDDHPILRQGLAKMLNDQPDMAVVGEAENGPAAMKVVGSLKPDMVSLDLSLGDMSGTDLCKQLHEAYGVPILVVSMHDEAMYAERCLRAGAMGYVMKQEPQDQVLGAFRQVAKGQVYLSPKMSARMLQSMSGARTDAGAQPLDRLSDREFEIFRLIGQGNGVRAIAEKLFLSPKTVEAHKEHIKQKLNLKSSSELLQYAIEARLT